MTIRVVPLEEVRRSAFERLLRDAWMQNWDEALASQIIQWRYFDRPSASDTWIVCDDDKCVGLLDSMLRPHLLRGERILVRETADWFVFPQYRVGHGLTLLGKIKSYAEPVLVIGGTQSTLQTLPRFRFKTVQMAHYYILPLTARGLAANALRRWDREQLAKTVPPMPLAPMRHPRTPSGGNIQLLSADADCIPLPHIETWPERYHDALIQIIEPSHWQWLTRMPRMMAVPAGLLFTINDTPVGCSICQIEPSASGLDGRIVHFQHSDISLASWIVAATVNFLRKRGVHFIRCCVSTPEKFAAVEAAGFLLSQRVPVHWFHRTNSVPSLIDAGYLRGDDAMPWQALRSRRLGRNPAPEAALCDEAVIRML